MIIDTPVKGNYHMKKWIEYRIELLGKDMSNVIIFPSERRQNQIEESERQKEKMRGNAPLIARSSDHLSKSSKFPPESLCSPSIFDWDSDGKPPNAA